MMDETASVAGVCVIAAILAVLLKQYCREHAMFCVIAACVTIGLAAMVSLTPIAEHVQKLFAETGLPEGYLSTLWKALGICYLTGIASDLCLDCGESALAHPAELWGRISLVLLSLPLLESLLQLVTEVLT